MKKDVLELEKGVTSEGGTYDELVFDQVPSRQLWCIQSGQIIDHTTAYTKLQIFKRTGNHDVELEEELSPAADELCWLGNIYYLREGQKLVARLTGCTDNDLLYGWLQGYRVEE